MSIKWHNSSGKKGFDNYDGYHKQRIISICVGDSWVLIPQNEES